MKIKEIKSVPNDVAREILEKKEKEREFTFEQRNALETLRKFKKLEAKDAEKLVEELKALGLRERQAVLIANIMPEDKDDLRVVLYKEYASFSEEEINKILQTVKKF